jgi:hypothetical protein
VILVAILVGCISWGEDKSSASGIFGTDPNTLDTLIYYSSQNYSKTLARNDAAKGNAVYGQCTWGSNAITPEKQRKELGNYGIASFETLQQSISAYMIYFLTKICSQYLASRSMFQSSDGLFLNLSNSLTS